MIYPRKTTFRKISCGEDIIKAAVSECGALKIAPDDSAIVAQIKKMNRFIVECRVEIWKDEEEEAMTDTKQKPDALPGWVVAGEGRVLGNNKNTMLVYQYHKDAYREAQDCSMDHGSAGPERFFRDYTVDPKIYKARPVKLVFLDEGEK
jgi:hypothetical protein